MESGVDICSVFDSTQTKLQPINFIIAVYKNSACLTIKSDAFHSIISTSLPKIRMGDWLKYRGKENIFIILKG